VALVSAVVLAKADALMLARVLPALVVPGVGIRAVALDVDGPRGALEGTALLVSVRVDVVKVALAVLGDRALESLAGRDHGGGHDNEELCEVHFRIWGRLDERRARVTFEM
jgi:hypothetical protein